MEIKPVRLVSNDAASDQENVDYNSLDVPPHVRRSQKTAKELSKAASKDMEYLDIPAFLRRQAD